MAGSPLTRWRVPFGFLFAFWYLWLVWTMPASASNLPICGMIVEVGCLIRAWAAGYLLKGKRVAVGGPYAFVRNPLYIGSFIIGIGFCYTLRGNPTRLSVTLFWIAFALLFGVFYQ